MELVVRCLEKRETIGVKKDCYQPGGKKKSLKYKRVFNVRQETWNYWKRVPLVLGIEQVGPGQVLSYPSYIYLQPLGKFFALSKYQPPFPCALQSLLSLCNNELSCVFLSLRSGC